MCIIHRDAFGMIQSNLSEGDSDPNKALIEQGSVITLSSQTCLVMGWDQGSCGLIENFLKNTSEPGNFSHKQSESLGAITFPVKHRLISGSTLFF